MSHRLELLRNSSKAPQQHEVDKASVLFDAVPPNTNATTTNATTTNATTTNATTTNATAASSSFAGSSRPSSEQPQGLGAQTQGALGARARPDLQTSRQDSRKPPRTTSAGTTPLKTISTKQVHASQDEERAGSMTRLRNLNADELADMLEEESTGRCYDDLLTFGPPQSDKDGAETIPRLRQLLEKGLHGRKGREQASAARPCPVEACMAALVRALKTGKDVKEAEIESAFVRLLNAAAAFLSAQTPQVHDGSTWQVGLPGHGPALFAKHSTSLMCQTSSKVPMRDKPDIVGLAEAQDVTERFRANTPDVRTWIEIKREASADLGLPLFRQILRYEYSRVVSAAAVGFSCGVTLCGRLLRVWRFDALGFSTSRALDFLDPEDLPEIASALTWLTGPATSLTEELRMETDTDYVFAIEDAPDGSGLAKHAYVRIRFQDQPQELNDPSLAGLFGRRTTVWGGTAAIVQTGTMEVGCFVPDDTVPARHNVPVVVKTAWLPDYLKWHEHRVLCKMGGKVHNVPRSLGLLADGHAGVPGGTHVRQLSHAEAKSDYLEDRAVQLHLCVMLQEIELGAMFPRKADVFDRGARMCALWALLEILYHVSLAGVHYRDLNRGNVLLKRNWVELLRKGDWRIVILIDFGNSRIGNARRGDAESPFNKDMPVGIDDVMSVNEAFVTTNALECIQLQEQRRQYLAELRHGIDVDQNEEDLRDLDEQLERMGHRCIDDIESGLYCWLYHHVLNPDADDDWRRRLDKAIFAKNTKNSLWHNRKEFRASVKDTLGGGNSLIDASVAGVLEEIRSTTHKAQDRLRDPDSKWPRLEVLTKIERETYLSCLYAIERWILQRYGEGPILSAAIASSAMASSSSASRQEVEEDVRTAEVVPHAARDKKSRALLDGRRSSGIGSRERSDAAPGATEEQISQSPIGRGGVTSATLHTPKTPSNLRAQLSVHDLTPRADEQARGQQALRILPSSGSSPALQATIAGPASPASPTKRGGPALQELLPSTGRAEPQRPSYTGDVALASAVAQQGVGLSGASASDPPVGSNAISRSTAAAVVDDAGDGDGDGDAVMSDAQEPAEQQQPLQQGESASSSSSSSSSSPIATRANKRQRTEAQRFGNWNGRGITKRGLRRGRGGA